jgi:2-polyprenyl-6-methoxyphenol hydroxylase-like FAD-dependent oxidoreductase
VAFDGTGFAAWLHCDVGDQQADKGSAYARLHGASFVTCPTFGAGLPTPPSTRPQVSPSTLAEPHNGRAADAARGVPDPRFQRLPVLTHRSSLLASFTPRRSIRVLAERALVLQRAFNLRAGGFRRRLDTSADNSRSSRLPVARHVVECWSRIAGWTARVF